MSLLPHHVVLALALAACSTEAPDHAGGVASAPDTLAGVAGTVSPDTSAGAATPAGEADVRRAFLASREALRALDVDAFLDGYADGPGLVVVDPAGEFVGRAEYEAFVRRWFEDTRRGADTFPIVTAPERVHVLDGGTAVVVVDWSVAGAPGPYRSLIVYRRDGGRWRIAAEHSAPGPQEDETPSPSRAPSAPGR